MVMVIMMRVLLPAKESCKEAFHCRKEERGLFFLNGNPEEMSFCGVAGARTMPGLLRGKGAFFKNDGILGHMVSA